MTTKEQTTRLSLITDPEAQADQALSNAELGRPIAGEEEWTREDYQLQIDHINAYADRMMEIFKNRTRLSLIKDPERFAEQARRNNELMDADKTQPIEGEEHWTKEDYDLQIKYCKAEGDKLVKIAQQLSETFNLSRPRNTPN